MRHCRSFSRSAWRCGELARLAGHLQPLLPRRGQHRGRRVAQQLRHVHVAQHQPHPPGLDLGDVEDRGDEVEQALALLHDDAEVLALLLGERPAQPLQHHLRVADDAGERGAQLVAHGGDEVGLEPVQLLEPQVAGLQLPVLLLQLAVALLHRLDVEPGRDQALVPGEDHHVEQVHEVPQDLLGGLGRHPADASACRRRPGWRRSPGRCRSAWPAAAPGRRARTARRPRGRWSRPRGAPAGPRSGSRRSSRRRRSSAPPRRGWSSPCRRWPRTARARPSWSRCSRRSRRSRPSRPPACCRPRRRP